MTRVSQISRQAVYRTPKPRSSPQRRPPADPVEHAIVVEAVTNQTRRLPDGDSVFFRVERPRQLWQLDMTSIWVAEHGWCYLSTIIDCCTREIVGWSLELRCRADEAIAVVEQAAATHGIQPGGLTLGTTTAPRSPPAASARSSAGSGSNIAAAATATPESQAFIESWFGKLKEREVWPNEYERLEDARRGIGGYINRYHHRPDSGVDYKTPAEVRQTWEDLHRGLNCQHPREAGHTHTTNTPPSSPTPPSGLEAMSPDP